MHVYNSLNMKHIEIEVDLIYIDTDLNTDL